MKAFSDYDTTKTYSAEGSSQLPVGGYVLKILNIKYENGENGNSDKLQLMFDVVEGDQKDFFKQQYDNNDSEDKKWKGKTTLYIPKDDGSKEDVWTKQKFKTFTTSVEDSNFGYAWNWNEESLKNKIVGGVFGDVYTLIDGKEIKYVALNYFTSASNIRENKFKPAKVVKKKGATGNISVTKPNVNDFVSVPDGMEEEIPF